MKTYQVVLSFQMKNIVESWEPKFSQSEVELDEAPDWRKVEQVYGGRNDRGFEIFNLTMYTKDLESVSFAKKRLIIEFRKITERHISRIKRFLTDDADRLLDILSKEKELSLI